ncbi:MAG TPA: CDP-glycerol glycerophosphotransferase family protein [Nocardioides sp.]|uniref:CDP-glycerol glycerophosphotransferase family protein n=1 Tax=Nocardioides sp. TaxID=35761 RepID=UPI002D7E7856|nr:CDP-glycerol glycerophosphotransferase family protein [Nocardioides sp.]HET6652572.1 CDP-glycerol glycerophosphotransferase family protein [Nocardioides sp.]
MSEARRRSWTDRLRRRVQASAGARRGSAARPEVSVVVVVRGTAGFLAECVTSALSAHPSVQVLLASLDPAAEEAARAATGDRRVRALPLDESPLDAAVAAARGDYLAFADADDTFPDDALSPLTRALDASGLDVAVGPVYRHSLGRARPPGWEADLFARPLRAGRVVDCADLLVGADLPGTLYRTSWWRDAGLSVADWSAREVTATRALLAARGIDVVPGRAYEARMRDVSLPIDAQARFRPAVVRTRVAALREVAGLVRETGPDTYRRWLVLTLTHVVPPLLVDAVGGGSRALELLAPLVRDLVGETGPGALAEVPVGPRLLARASQGTLHDVALVQDLLADNPHGLPTERSAEGAQVVRLPVGLGIPVPDAVRRIEQVDRVLRTVVGPLRRTPDGGFVVNGAAFVEYGERATVPSVTVAGSDGRHVPMTVQPRVAPDINIWAGRAWEDRSGAGFTGSLEPELVPPSPDGTLRLEVHLGRRSGVHEGVPADDDPASGSPMTAAALDDGCLLVTGAGLAPATVRLVGGKGSTKPAPVTVHGGGWSVRLPLVTDLFSASVLLPAGRYTVEALDPAGEQVAVGWALDGAHDELVTDRLRIVPGGGPGQPVVAVAAPLGVSERSAFDQQRLQSHVYAAPSSPSYDTTVVLETFRGRSVGDSPGAIGREIQQRGLDLDLDLAWVVDDPSVQVPDGTRALPRRSERWYDALARARVYVGNAGAPYWFEKKPGQLHLQTWHGTPLKRLGEDRGPGDFQTWRHRRRIAAQAAGWDAMISPSPFCSEVFRSAFRYDGRFLEVGYPRNDVLVGPEREVVRTRVREALGLTPADRAVLYAPTWREYVGVRDAKPLYLDAPLLTRLAPDTVVLVRGHYNSTHQADVFVGDRRIRDVTRYPDIADLYLAADALVTDYSSVMFDFALTDKPQVLLVPDLEQYRDVERGFYFELEAAAPGPMVATTEDVADALLGDDGHAVARAAFRERFCPWDDGRASARTVDWLLSQI